MDTSLKQVILRVMNMDTVLCTALENYILILMTQKTGFYLNLIKLGFVLN